MAFTGRDQAKADALKAELNRVQARRDECRMRLFTERQILIDDTSLSLKAANHEIGPDELAVEQAGLQKRSDALCTSGEADYLTMTEMGINSSLSAVDPMNSVWLYPVSDFALVYPSGSGMIVWY